MPEIQKPEDKSGKLCMCKVNLGLGLFTFVTEPQIFLKTKAENLLQFLG